MIVPSLNEINDLWIKGDHLTVAKWLPYFNKGTHSTLIENLKKSNLSLLKEKLSLPPITLGADPEFILCQKDKPDEIVMFSSADTNDKFGISEAEVGADYGLLEFRPKPENSPVKLISSIEDLHKEFNQRFPSYLILKKEAIEYNHEMARIKKTIKLAEQGKETPAYGGYHGKETSVWSSQSSSNSNGKEIVLDETCEVSLSAYGKPEFKKYRPDILSAGGHVHIGGTFIKALSIEQLNRLIQNFDKDILSLAERVETEAAQLRKSVYGSPGEYRLKEYGIEYRSPSNAIFWLENQGILLQVLDLIVKNVKEFLFL